jgi:hypothetical protein
MIQDMLGLPYVPVLAAEQYSDELLTKYTFDKIEVRELTITDFNEENIGGVLKTTKIPHEGVVIKSIDGDRRKVAKVINPDYLIYGEKHNVGDSH